MSLDHLKAGDKVYINNRYNGITIHTIDRVTKTQIIIGNTKYNKNGSQIGAYSRWSREYIYEITPDIIAEYNIQKLQKKLLKINTIKINKENYSQIKKLTDELFLYV